MSNYRGNSWGNSFNNPYTFGESQFGMPARKDDDEDEDQGDYDEDQDDYDEDQGKDEEGDYDEDEGEEFGDGDLETLLSHFGEFEDEDKPKDEPDPQYVPCYWRWNQYYYSSDYEETQPKEFYGYRSIRMPSHPDCEIQYMFLENVDGDCDTVYINFYNCPDLPRGTGARMLHDLLLHITISEPEIQFIEMTADASVGEGRDGVRDQERLIKHYKKFGFDVKDVGDEVDEDGLSMQDDNYLIGDINECIERIADYIDTINMGGRNKKTRNKKRTRNKRTRNKRRAKPKRITRNKRRRKNKKITRNKKRPKNKRITRNKRTRG